MGVWFTNESFHTRTFVRGQTGRGRRFDGVFVLALHARREPGTNEERDDSHRPCKARSKSEGLRTKYARTSTSAETRSVVSGGFPGISAGKLLMRTSRHTGSYVNRNMKPLLLGTFPTTTAQ